MFDSRKFDRRCKGKEIENKMKENKNKINLTYYIYLLLQT